MFQKYRDAGFCVIPLKDGMPKVEWSKYMNQLPDDVSSWEKFNEYALVCGNVSGVIALDIDIDDTARIEALAGVSPVKKFGTKGFTAFYKYNGEKSQNWKANGQIVCELLSDKRLTTIPPSKHRKEGIYYTWLDKELIATELPYLNDDFILLMNAKFPRPIYNSKPEHSIFAENIDYNKANEMLSFISADLPRDEWIKVGMALKDEFGDSAATLWHKWSAKSDKYNARDAYAAWRSFNHEGIGIGTLAYMAKQSGWMPVTPKDENDLSYIYKKKVITQITAHGLVGEIADWMARTAWKPQPLLSLSAALVLMGFLKGRKYITTTGVYSNIYAFNIAGSACGKDRPQAAISHILQRMKCDYNLLNKPASATGFIDSLLSVGGHGITVIDEMADYISSATAKGGNFKARVLTDWMMAFTSCAGHLDGERRADASKEKVKRVYNPLFCLLGSTNPISLKDALSGNDVSSGLLNRFLFFNSDESPRKRKFKDFDLNEQLPESTIEKLRSYMIGNTDIYGTQAALQKVPFSIEALKISDDISDYYEDEAQKLDKNDRLRYLYGRAHEYVIKVALILCDDVEITKKDIDCAQEIVKFSVNNAIKFCGDISDTREEKDFNAVKQFIRESGKTTLGKITSKIRSVRPPRIKEIVTSLEDNGEIKVEIVPTKGRSNYMVYWIQ